MMSDLSLRNKTQIFKNDRNLKITHLSVPDFILGF